MQLADGSQEEDLVAMLASGAVERGCTSDSAAETERMMAVMEEMRAAAQDIERAGRALAAAGRRGKASGSSTGGSGLGASRVLMGVLLTIHTVIVATITALATVGMLTGAPWRELMVRLVQR